MTNAIIEKAKERFAHTHESLARDSELSVQVVPMLTS